MAKETRSETRRDSTVLERIFNDEHFECEIGDGDDSVERWGRTAEEAEERASESWEEDDEDDE